jgi:metal-responsive CopG/Arc/MetJ family transcriptional regulator
MKTAISLPDDLFRSAEAVARKLRLSRSELYAAAIREYLERRRASNITARLDEIYSKEPARLDPALNAAQLNSLENDSW